jgi:hypothetical protein
MQHYVYSIEGIKCVHELTMGGPDGPPMSVPIYYVVLACSGGYGCSRCEPREPCEHSWWLNHSHHPMLCG